MCLRRARKKKRDNPDFGKPFAYTLSIGNEAKQERSKMATGREVTTFARDIVTFSFVAIMAMGLAISTMAGPVRMSAAENDQGGAADFTGTRFVAAKNPLLRQVVQQIRHSPLDGLRLRRV